MNRKPSLHSPSERELAEPKSSEQSEITKLTRTQTKDSVDQSVKPGNVLQFAIRFALVRAVEGFTVSLAILWFILC